MASGLGTYIQASLQTRPEPRTLLSLQESRWSQLSCPAGSPPCSPPSGVWSLIKYQLWKWGGAPISLVTGPKVACGTHSTLSWIFLFLFFNGLIFCAKACKFQIKTTCPTLCDPMDGSPPCSSVHGILEARILERVAISSTRGFSRPRDQTHVSCILYIGRQLLYH